MSQTGFARTLVAWGDPRSFDVVLRWVQRAVAGLEPGPYPGMVIGILRRHIKDRRAKHRLLRLLESGKMRSGQNMGNGWKDTTESSIAETKRQIAELDGLLSQCRLPETPTLSLEDLNADALKRFQRICVVPDDDDDSVYVIWQSLRLLPFVSADASGTLLEDATIYVVSLSDADLDPVYAAITAAGGERGIVRVG
jgi:hypothetical protein